jgi:hypothetical protein
MRRFYDEWETRKEQKTMFCDEVKKLLVAYLHGELARSERALLAMHLTQCHDCQRELDAIADTESRIADSLKSVASSVAPSKDAWSRLQNAIADKQPNRSLIQTSLNTLGLRFSNLAIFVLPLFALIVASSMIVVSVINQPRVMSEVVIVTQALPAIKPLFIQRLTPPPDPDVNLLSSFLAPMSGEIVDDISPIQPCAACIRYR